MLTLREEQLNMVSGGAVAQQNVMDDTDQVVAGALVIWNGHENMGKGLVDLDVLGICLVEFEKKSFPWFDARLICWNELTIVGYIDPHFPIVH